TELVVATALRLAPHARRIVDVGTGSGAIAIALSTELPAARVVASDRLAPPLAVASANPSRLAPGVTLVQAELLAGVPTAAFALVVGNPPYCETGAVVQAEVRDWEPATALYAGAGGLDALDALVDEAPRVLAPGGWLVVEVGIGQAEAVVARVRASGRYDRSE